MKMIPMPVSYRVLVKLEKLDEKYKEVDGHFEEISKSGITLAVKTKNEVKRENTAAQKALVCEVGPQAFADFGDGSPWCQKGDVVVIAKYSGGMDFHDIEEGEIYRIIDDKDIFAVYRGVS